MMSSDIYHIKTAWQELIPVSGVLPEHEAGKKLEVLPDASGTRLRGMVAHGGVCRARIRCATIDGQHTR